MKGSEGYIYYLNSELLETERIFKLSSALINKDNTLVVKLIVNAKDYDNLLDEALREKVEAITHKIVPPPYKAEVVYAKTISDESYVIECVNKFFYQESPLVFRKLSECKIETNSNYDTITVRMTVPPYIFSFLETNNYQEKLVDYLDSLIMEQIEVHFFVDDKAQSKILIKRKPQVPSSKLKIIEVSDLESVVGAVSRMPKYISEAASAESDNQTICGKVSSFAQKTAKSTGKPYFTMRLDDTTGTIEAVFFARDQKVADSFLQEIADNTEVCAEGPIRISKYSNTFSMQIRRISRCKINYASISNYIVYLDEPEAYTTIIPMPYTEEEQYGLFDTNKSTPDELAGTFVVYDLETTGLIPTQDKIIEIGAVKMQDGKIIESFSTLINPERPIPPDASKTNNIFDEDVANAPKIADVIGDFYKFTRGAVLVGHNSELFDNNFLLFWGKQYRYNFDNDSLDTLKLAKQKIPSGKHKLSILCKKFDIPLANAHRALYDAEATAKLLRKLIELP